MVRELSYPKTIVSSYLLEESFGALGRRYYSPLFASFLTFLGDHEYIPSFFIDCGSWVSMGDH